MDKRRYPFWYKTESITFWMSTKLELEQNIDSHSNIFPNNWTKKQPQVTPKPNPLNPIQSSGCSTLHYPKQSQWSNSMLKR